MTDIVLLAIGPNDVGDRQVFKTGLSTVGRGTNDYYCGHCGHQMMTRMNLETMEVDMVFECGQCKCLNLRPPQ